MGTMSTKETQEAEEDLKQAKLYLSEFIESTENIIKKLCDRIYELEDKVDKLESTNQEAQ